MGGSILQNLITQSLLVDLAEINDHSQGDLEVLVNSNVVITGASGFIGTWLTLSWASARRKYNGKGKLLITCRFPDEITKMALQIDGRCPISNLPSDIRNLHIPDEYQSGYIIHAATPASASLNRDDPQTMFGVIIEGQERVLSEALRLSSRLLFLSSGAVYGRQPLELGFLSEDKHLELNIESEASAYHDGKRAAELQSDIAVQTLGADVVTARLFAFLAPFLPFGTHFAAGNFIQDALNGSAINIKSGGGSVRSYQYATDLCTHLWALLSRGITGEKYNVGSEAAVTIKELALAIAQNINPSIQVVVSGIDTTENLTRYVPSVKKIESQLAVKNHVDLDESIRRTASWWKQSEGG